jgi:hypothetical protein
VAVLQVTYHLDKYLPDLDFPLEAAQIITADTMWMPRSCRQVCMAAASTPYGLALVWHGLMLVGSS